jgi:hypothetical protein
MSTRRELVRRWLRGTLDRLRENTAGGDVELVALLNKINAGLFTWNGPAPCGFGAKKRRAR